MQLVEGNPVSPFGAFTALSLGLQDAAYVIFFLFILGGVFKIIEIMSSSGLLSAKNPHSSPACSAIIFALSPNSSVYASTASGHLPFMQKSKPPGAVPGSLLIRAGMYIFCSS